MVIKSVNLETVSGVTSKLARHTFPEFAFAGKSNVGKSTLINGLMNRKSYARTSSQPGKTQTINYYNINDRFYLVDLPGYGYAAAAAPEVKMQWGRMIENFLKESPTLQEVFLLLDMRHEPSDNDIMMFDWILQAGFDPVIIATKSDKVAKSRLEKQKALLLDSLKKGSTVLKKDPSAGANIRLVAYSAMDQSGRDRIYSILDNSLRKK
ncbi:MAG: ribosome biogenesis GTP-binding protein YihA/YsxC [Lachnospiraceae bacterium]|nr:ribosome biogenesis GTP-binding protein YihA/YsxC [Lachnospiraceae bacterium]